MTREVRVRTNRVFKWVSRFLLVGRTEKKKLQSARQDEFEMTIDRVYLQADQLIILDLDIKCCGSNNVLLICLQICWGFLVAF